ncbi:MAG: hypothetical protein KGY60_11125 [Bacteroidales bacterium]|nr:hypothetical protein [Bacteroidales bacterium]
MQHRHRKKKARESSSESSSTVEESSTRSQEEKQNKQDSQDSSESETPKASSRKEPTQDTPAESTAQPRETRNSVQGAPGHSDTFSINQVLKKGQQNPQVREQPLEEEQEEQEQAPTDTGKDRAKDFSQEQVEEALKSLAERYREKPRIYNMLRSRKPEKKEEGVILIPLENHLQEQQISKIYNTALIHLKNSLQNDYISLKTELLKDQTSNNKLYTDEDKYKHMEQKNQNLRQLRQDFDLDFD